MPMTNPAHTPVALDEKGLEAAYAATILGEDEYGNPVHIERDEAETAIRAYLSAVGGEAVTDSLWVTAKPEHAKIGWTYDFDQTERLSRAAEAATGYDAVLEVVEFVMAEADRRHRSELARLKAQPGVVKAAQDAVAELANVPMQLSLEDWSRISNAILAALSAPVSQEPIARQCTCHPDDNPPKPCAEKYALSECLAASSPITEGEPSDAEVERLVRLAHEAYDASQPHYTTDQCFEAVVKALLAAKSKGGQADG